MIIRINKIGDDEIVAAIKDNDGYCICAVDHTPDTKCMCKEFRDMEEGICHCGLYEKKILDKK